MPLPVPISPAPGVALLTWAEDHIDVLKAHLRETGLVWLRGFTAAEPDLAQQLLTLLGVELMDDVFFSTPRSAVADKTFTATEYPRDRVIPLHSEMAYLNVFPRLLCLHALVCADTGGETTVGDLDAVTADLGELPERFHQARVRYLRVFHPGVDIALTTAFGTDDLDEVHAIAAKYGMTLDIGDGGGPRLTYTGPGALRDTATGNLVWFNQAALHHPARLDGPVRDVLTQMYGAGSLPRQACYGDGTPITDATVETIAAVLERHTRLVAWQPGDVVLLDNLRYLHGRASYEGARTVHVAMGMPCHDGLRAPLFTVAEDSPRSTPVG
jgi:hypothetical protein